MGGGPTAREQGTLEGHGEGDGVVVVVQVRLRDWRSARGSAGSRGRREPGGASAGSARRKVDDVERGTFSVVQEWVEVRARASRMAQGRRSLGELGRSRPQGERKGQGSADRRGQCRTKRSSTEMWEAGRYLCVWEKAARAP